MRGGDPFGFLTAGASAFFPYLIGAWIALILGNGLWAWRLKKVAARNEELRVALGGSALRGAGKNAPDRSPLIRPGWLSVIPSVLVVGFIVYSMDADLKSVMGWVFGAIVIANVGQVVYNEVFSKWAKARRLLRRAVFTFDDESRELAIREALSWDPEVGEKARAAAPVPGVLPTGTPLDGLAPATPQSTGPRLSDAPPPL